MSEDFFTEGEKMDIREIALEEIGEIVDGIKADCARLEGGCDAAEFVKSAAIRVHTIAGSAALAGLMEISKVGAGAESFIRKYEGSDAALLLEKFRVCAVEIEEMLRDARQGARGDDNV